jgi:hypothetical protein
VAQADAVLLLEGSTSAATALLVTSLFMYATYELRNQSSGSTGMAMRPMQQSGTNHGSRASQRTIEEAEKPVPVKHGLQKFLSGLSSHASDVLPVAVKVLQSRELQLVMFSFAFTVAPLLATFWGMQPLLEDGSYLGGDGPKAIVSVFFFVGACLHRLGCIVPRLCCSVCGSRGMSTDGSPCKQPCSTWCTSAGIVMPFVLQLPFRSTLVGPVTLVLAQMALLAVVAAYMFVTILDPPGSAPLAVLALVGMCGTVSASFSLERALVIMRRERPAVVAGIMWSVAYCLTIILCVLQEFVLFRRGGNLSQNLSEWKWMLPLSFTVSMGLAVTALISSGRCGLLSHLSSHAPHHVSPPWY